MSMQLLHTFTRTPQVSPSAATIRTTGAARARDAFQRLAALLHLWRDRARGRRALANMDARQRKDIGLDNLAVCREISKPFWIA